MLRSLAVLLLVLAVDRQWQSGTWGTALDERTYTILSDASRLELEDVPPGDRRALAVTAGAAVKFAVEKDDVFVVDRAGAEHKLHLMRQVSLAYTGVGGGHYLKTVDPEGQTLMLEDGSIWEIDPRSHYFTARWQPLEGIAVRRADPDNGFNYEIDNTDQDNGALARFSPR